MEKCTFELSLITFLMIQKDNHKDNNKINKTYLKES